MRINLNLYLFLFGMIRVFDIFQTISIKEYIQTEFNYKFYYFGLIYSLIGYLSAVSLIILVDREIFFAAIMLYIVNMLQLFIIFQLIKKKIIIYKDSLS